MTEVSRWFAVEWTEGGAVHFRPLLDVMERNWKEMMEGSKEPSAKSKEQRADDHGEHGDTENPPSQSLRRGDSSTNRKTEDRRRRLVIGLFPTMESAMEAVRRVKRAIREQRAESEEQREEEMDEGGGMRDGDNARDQGLAPQGGTDGK